MEQVDHVKDVAKLVPAGLIRAIVKGLGHPDDVALDFRHHLPDDPEILMLAGGQRLIRAMSGNLARKLIRRGDRLIRYFIQDNRMRIM